MNSAEIHKALACRSQILVALLDAPESWNPGLHQPLLSTEERTMWKRWIFAIAIFSGLAAQAKAGEIHHMSCTIVRLYVAKYSAPAAEAWARSQGATEAEIMVARRCLRDGPVRTATDLSAAGVH
jgi:hypothetical protein